MPLIEIDPEGDVTLRLVKHNYGEQDKIVSILVSSKVLTLTSRVFTALLGPSFQDFESQRSASGTPSPVITLPDNDADAMTLLCHILHFNYSALPKKPEMEVFVNLARLCDEYECVALVKFVAEDWLLLWEKTAEGVELEHLLFISYLFDRPERFSAVSLRIIREFDGSLKHQATLEEYGYQRAFLVSQCGIGFNLRVTKKISGSLHYERKSTLQKIEALVADQLTVMEDSSVKSFSDKPKEEFCLGCWDKANQTDEFCKLKLAYPTCTIESRWGIFVGLLRDATLDPIGLWTGMATRSIIEIAECFRLAAVLSTSAHRCTGSSDCTLISTMWKMRAEVNGSGGLISRIRGLYLDCIKAGRGITRLPIAHSDTSLCRVDHGWLWNWRD